MKNVLLAITFVSIVLGLSACSEEFNASPVAEEEVENVKTLQPLAAGFNKNLYHKVFKIEDKWDALYEGPLGKVPSELLH
jgi:hypothetical protein